MNTSSTPPQQPAPLAAAGPDGPMACAVCARVLATRSSPGGHADGYEHEAADRPADHAPIPVPAEAIAALARCDFCLAADPPWVVPARPFRFQGTRHESTSAWAACDTCADLIGRRQWAGLRRHVVARYVAEDRTDGLSEAQLVGSLNWVWRQLRPNITGQPVRKLLAHRRPPPTNSRGGHRIEGGYDWIATLANGWYPVGSWGAAGWDLGTWPYAIVAHYDGPDCYAHALYVEGDLTITTAHTRAERDAHTDRTAWYYWRNGTADGPADLAADDEHVAPDHRGPYQPGRRTAPADPPPTQPAHHDR
jgi:hypothetical protein